MCNSSKLNSPSSRHLLLLCFFDFSTTMIFLMVYLEFCLNMSFQILMGDDYKERGLSGECEQNSRGNGEN